MNEADHLELLEWLAEVRNDPLAYVLGAFEWGQGELARYSGPDIWQADVLESIGKGVRSVDEAIALAREAGEEADTSPIREATTSGHGIGKSALVAWIMLWAIDTEVDAKGRVTANTENQLKTTTWAELAKWHRLSITSELFRMTATARFSIDPNHERTWRMDMVPWSEKNSAAFAGLHNHGKRILLVFDEASEIPDKIWEVSEGAMTDRNTQIIWAVFGNPTRNTGRFRECFAGGRFAHRWNSRAIDARTVKISNKKELEGWVEDYGLDHDFTRVRVLGQFPRTDATSFIDLSDVIEAQSRPVPEGQGVLPIIGGLDVARLGPDASVLAIRQGKDARSRKWPRAYKLNTVQLARWAFEQFMRHNLSALVVDVGGVGGGVFDQLELMGIEVYPCDFGSRATNSDGEKFLNKRAEIHASMRRWVKEGGALPPDEGAEGRASLRDQLCAATYTYSRDVALQLESKKDIRRRLGISPDDSDALAITFGEPWLDEAPGMMPNAGGAAAAYNETSPYEGGHAKLFTLAG